MERKVLQKLSRADLMELLLELTRENTALRQQLSEAEERLQAQHIRISRSGSLAEAALALAGVFQAADEACRIYRENFWRLTQEMANDPTGMEAENETEEAC